MAENTTRYDTAKAMLGNYKVYKQALDADIYAEDYAGGDASFCDRALYRAQMEEIECFVRSLPVCREQTMLYNHFIRGHSVEFCGEMMYLSRRTAYRVLKSAISLAAEFLPDRLCL